MWLLTPFGFFSIVQKPWDRKDGMLTVRARVRADLEALREGFMPELGEIAEDAGADYRYRARATQEAVAEAAKRVALAIDYDNFKSEVARRQGRERADLYHRVWEALGELQPPDR